MKLKTVGVSPKVIASAITGTIVYVVTKVGLKLDPELEQLLNVLAMVAAGYIAPAGETEEA